LIEKTETQAGLKVTADVLDKVYETGRKAARRLKSATEIVWDTVLPMWNYTVLPSG